MTEASLATPSAGRRRNYGLLVAARGVSTFGTGFGPVALAFGLLALPGGGPTLLSLVLACNAVPQLLFVLVAGGLADRLPRARLLVAAECVAGIAWAAIGVMLVTGAAPTPVLAGCAGLAGLASAMVGPALVGLVPELVLAERLRAANSTLKTATHVARVAGLAAAGPTVALIGPGWALLVDAATYLVAGALVACLRPLRPGGVAASGMLQDLRDGWREFTGRQWLWVQVTAYSFTYAMVNAVTGVLGPLAAHAYLRGATAWSLILTAQAIGTLIGAVGARWVDPERPALAVTVLISVAGVPMVLMAAAAPLSLVAVGAAIGGVAAGIVSVLATTVMQQHVAEAALCRVSAYDWLGSLALTPLALALAGPAAEIFGIRQTLAACGVIVLTSSVAAASSAQVRTLRRIPPTETSLAGLTNEEASPGSPPARPAAR